MRVIYFLTENIGTILTALVLLVIITAIILKIIWDRRMNASKGCAGSSCGCCAGCPRSCGK